MKRRKKMVGVHLIEVVSQIVFLLSIVWLGFDVLKDDTGTLFFHIAYSKLQVFSSFVVLSPTCHVNLKQ